MDVLSTIIIERIIDLAFAAGILVSAVPFVVGAAGAGRIAMVIGGVLILGLVTLYFLARNREKVLGLFERVTAPRPKLKKLGEGFLTPFFSGLAILTDGWLFLRVLLWMALDWAISIVQFYFLVLAFFPHATLLWSVFGLGTVAFGNAIPSLPGAVGTFEGAFGWALTVLSGDQSTALAAALVAHLFNYLSTGIIGTYALTSEGETLMGIYRQLRKNPAALEVPVVQGNLLDNEGITSVDPLHQNDAEKSG